MTLEFFVVYLKSNFCKKSIKNNKFQFVIFKVYSTDVKYYISLKNNFFIYEKQKIYFRVKIELICYKRLTLRFNKSI